MRIGVNVVVCDDDASLRAQFGRGPRRCAPARSWASVRGATEALARYVAAGADTVNVAARPWDPGAGRAAAAVAALRPDRHLHFLRGTMTDVRIDELSGATVVVAGTRRAAPTGPAARAFCVGGTEAPEPYRVRAFVNRWPSLPDDRCEVVLYTPEHDQTFPGLGLDGARRVVDLWAERTEALGARPDVAYVLVFENRGEEVGATIAHPHGQIYAYDRVPDAPLTELRRAARGECPVCARVDEALSVATTAGWHAWVPAASAYPYSLLLAPDVHRPDLPSLDGPQRRTGRAAGRRAGPARPPVRHRAPLHAVDPPAADRRRRLARGARPPPRDLADARGRSTLRCRRRAR